MFLNFKLLRFFSPLILITSLLAYPITGIAQQVSSCAELGLDPNIATGERNIKLPTGGCWVHHHSNGKDYVVTPGDWGDNPTGAHKTMINDAMLAITKSRSIYEAYGSLDSDLYFIFDNVDRPGEFARAFWIVDNNCWMVSGESSISRTNSLDRQQVFAHEIGHCVIMENVPDLIDNYALNHWFDESISEYLSSEVYKENNMEFRFSRQYDMDSSFQQKYRAYTLWYYFAKKRGRESIVPYMNQLAALSTKNRRLAHMRRTGFDQLFHHFLFEFYQNDIMDSGGGTHIPANTDVDPLLLVYLDPDGGSIDLTPVPSERLSIFELVLPADYDLILDAPPRSGTFNSIIAKTGKVKDWVSREKVKGQCGVETVVQILVSQLTGVPIEGISLKYDLKEQTFCCPEGLAVEENPSEQELDGAFNFDYYIESVVNYKTSEESESIPFNYYVNSQDGSMLLTDSWFDEAFGSTASGGFEAQAVIWLPNGQLVGYVDDKHSGQKRAITLNINQTKGDLRYAQSFKVTQFLREAYSTGIAPAPLPPGSPWQDRSKGAAYYQSDSSDPTVLNLVSAYISDTTNAISSPLSNFGFMAGFVKDLEGKGRMMPYSQVVRPNGDMFETHMLNMYTSCAYFDAHGYKKMSLGGNTGAISSMTEEEQNQFADRQDALQKRLMQTIAAMADCNGDKACEAEIQRTAMAIQKQIQDEYYDLQEDNSLSGTDGSDFQNQQRRIQDQMYGLENEILDKELRCDQLSERDARCGGCVRSLVESCKEEYQQLQDRMVQLECDMARLHGVEDALEECR